LVNPGEVLTIDASCHDGADHLIAVIRNEGRGMQVSALARPKTLAIAAVVAVAIGGGFIISSKSADAAPVAAATTTVAAQPGGGYITTYTDVNGNVTKVYAATPVAITTLPTTARQVTVAGKAVTQHTGGVSFAPTGAAAKVDKDEIWRSAKAAADAGSTVSAYDALVALGVSPTDASRFNVGGSGSGSGTHEAESGVIPLSGGGTQIGPPACVDQNFDGTHGHVFGCTVTRKVGQSGSVWYLTDESESSGTMHDTGCTFCDHITGLKFGTQYGSGNVIQSWDPGSTSPVGSCVTNTASITFHGIGVSSTATQCPATFGLYSKTSTYYSTKWDGQGNGPNNGSRETHSVDGVYNGASASPYPTVDAQWWYTTT
jgi:hypothetical protein